jgi:probable HAF family extracellular repeat protein
MRCATDHRTSSTTNFATGRTSLPKSGPGELVLNNRGMLAGKADTPVPDPNGPDPNSCAVPSCFLPHTFLWERGALTDLGTLPGGSSSDVGSINARGWISGGSTNGEIDPLTGGPVFHAVLWRNGQITDLGTLGTGLESAGAYVQSISCSARRRSERWS